MPADQHLSGPQFLYHEAHLNDRESIRSEGLRPGKAWQLGYGAETETVPAGVYMNPRGRSEYSSSMNDASHFGYDTWRVDVSGLPVHGDPSQPSSGEGARYTPEAIHPSRIKLAKKGHPDWKKHI